MIGFGNQKVCGMSQPSDAINDKAGLKGKPLNRKHVRQIAQQLRRIDFAKTCRDLGINRRFGTSEPSSAYVHNVHPKVLLRSARAARNTTSTAEPVTSFRHISVRLCQYDPAELLREGGPLFVSFKIYA